MAQSWIGIRLSAALALLGSLAALVAATVVLRMASRLEDAPNVTRAMLVVLVVFFGVLALWGLLTGGGVLGRRSWARISMVIFAVLLVGMGLSALVGLLFIRMPSSAPAGSGPVIDVRRLLAAFYGGLTLIGAWWLLLFSSAHAKLYFSEPRPPAGTPVSIDVVGWCLLLLAIATAAAAMLRVPAPVFGTVVTDWSALAIYTAYTAAEIYLGTGLLGRVEAARIGAIVYCGFLAMNAVAWVMLPGFPVRTQVVLGHLPRVLRLPVSPGGMDFAALLAWLGCALAAVPIWLLVSHRADFRAAANQKNPR